MANLLPFCSTEYPVGVISILPNAMELKWVLPVLCNILRCAWGRREREGGRGKGGEGRREREGGRGKEGEGRREREGGRGRREREGRRGKEGKGRGEREGGRGKEGEGRRERSALLGLTRNSVWDRVHERPN